MGQVKEMDDGTANTKMNVIRELLKIKIRSVTILTKREQSTGESTGRSTSIISRCKSC